jgi:hypothetical protein
VSSQRPQTCRGALQAYVVSFFATALCEQFQLGLGARILSRIGRPAAPRSITQRHQTAVAISHIGIFPAAAHADTATVMGLDRNKNSASQFRFSASRHVWPAEPG